MDIKWKKWINTICIAAVLVMMSAAGIYGLMECNAIASSGAEYASLDSFEDNAGYKTQIQSDLVELWAEQEELIGGSDVSYGISKKKLEEIAKESRVKAELVIKPYGRKQQKKSFVYGGAKEGEQGGTSSTLKISRNKNEKLDRQGRFVSWENYITGDASYFYIFSGEPYIPLEVPGNLLINDDAGWRLESGQISVKLTPKAIEIMEDVYDQAQNTLISSLKSFVVIGAVEVLGLLLLIILFAFQKKRTRFFCWLDRIWWEAVVIASGALLGCAGGLYFAVWEFTVQYASGSGGGTEAELAMMLCSIAMPAVISLFAVCLQTTVWRVKQRKLLDSTLCLGYFRRWFRKERERRSLEYQAMSFSEQHAQDRIRQYRAVRIFLLVFILCCILSTGATGGMGIIFAVLGGFGIYKLNEYSDKYAREQLDLSKLMEQIQQISDGKLSAEADLDRDSAYYEYSKKLTNIGNGMEKALETQMKGERMKIDLITNVSHDLKTPLTSIIGYVDLLSRDPSLSGEAKDYVKILNQKTERLKHIIADLFELAKSTSGDAKVELEPMDMKRLIEQTLGDMEDQIHDSGFEIRFQCTSEQTRFLGDVNRMYRVVQNIIENALKYSLQGTRIFIRITEEASKIKLEVMNTASYEMDFTEEEIMERFARAEKSRTSEGNGLGLSIADSFTKNCGGTFEIKINGDQFKVTVQFPQYLE